jgi:O-antigen/teichoic acid export membrane protein
VLAFQSTRKRTTVTLLDQVFSSGSNFVLVILVARASDTAQFGVFTIAYGVITFALALSRSAVGVPLGTDLPTATRPEAQRLLGHATSAALVVGAGTGLAVMVIGLVTGIGEPMRSTMFLFAVACPVIVLQDVWRFCCVASGRPGQALASDGLWFLVGFGALVWTVATEHGLDTRHAGAVWLLGGVLALLSLSRCAVASLPRWKGFVGSVLLERRRLHLSSDAALSALTPLTVALGVAALASAQTVGALRGASTLMSPINVTVAAVQLGAIAEVSRRHPATAARMMRQLTTLLCLGTLLWGVVVVGLPSAWGRSLLGETWAPAHHVLPFTVVEYVGISIWTGAMSLLRARHRTGEALRLRVVYATTSIVAAPVVALATKEAAPVALTLAIVAVLLGLLSWAVVRSGGRSAAAVQAHPL